MMAELAIMDKTLEKKIWRVVQREDVLTDSIQWRGHIY